MTDRLTQVAASAAAARAAAVGERRTSSSGVTLVPPQDPDAVGGPTVVDEKLDELTTEQIMWFISRKPAKDRPEVAMDLQRNLMMANVPSWHLLSRHDCLMLELLYHELCTTPALPLYNQNFEPSVETSMMSIKGDLWQADVGRRLAFPVYWDGPPCRLVRGTWFLEFSASDLQPLNEEVALQIEDVYQTKPWLSRDRKDPLKLYVNDKKHFVLFFAEDMIRIYEESLLTTVMQFVQKEKSGVKLARAGRPMETTTEKTQRLEDEQNSHDVNHLVLVVHGIGQRLESSDINQDVEKLQSRVEHMCKLHAKADYQRGSIRLLPVQWRTNLDLFCDEGASCGDYITIAEITPKELEGVRKALNMTAVDVLLFMTPQHRHRILAKVASEINRIYSKFVERNPEFLLRKGKVSVIGHSLGSVIMFDILTQVNSVMFTSLAIPEIDDDDEMRALKVQMRALENQIQRHKRKKEMLCTNQAIADNTGDNNNIPIFEPLKFDVDHLFVLGSPIGIFMCIRGSRFAPSRSEALPNSNLVFPAVRKLYHLFHSSDPIAYRIEPFMDRSTATKSPVPLPEASQAGKKLAPKSGGYSELFGWLATKALPSGANAPISNNGASSSLLDVLGDGRVDYMIKPGMFTVSELINAGQGVMAHMAYWENDDIALCIVVKLLDLRQET